MQAYLVSKLIALIFRLFPQPLCLVLQTPAVAILRDPAASYSAPGLYPEAEAVEGGGGRREVGPLGLDDVLEELADHLLPGGRDADLRVVQLVEEEEVLGLDLVELGLPVGSLSVMRRK